MNEQLAKLVSDYQASVRTAVELLEASGIPRPTSNDHWVGYGIPHNGTLVGGVTYFKHGYGCRVDLPDGAVDFDFGEQGQIDGFDAWRLAGYARGRLREYGFPNEASLNEAFAAAAASGSLVHSGYILYFRAPAA